MDWASIGDVAFIVFGIFGSVTGVVVGGAKVGDRILKSYFESAKELAELRSDHNADMIDVVRTSNERLVNKVDALDDKISETQDSQAELMHKFDLFSGSAEARLNHLERHVN